MIAIANYQELFYQIVKELDNSGWLVYIRATRIRGDDGLWNLETPMGTENSVAVSLVCKVWYYAYEELRVKVLDLHKQRVYGKVKPIDLEAEPKEEDKIVRYVNLDWAPTKYVRDFTTDLDVDWNVNICEMETEDFFPDFEYSSNMDYRDW